MKTLIILLLFASTLYAQPFDYTQPPLEITEVDLSPTTYPYSLKFPNGSLTDDVSGTIVDFVATDSLNSTYIRTDGSSTTSASIPFAQGLSVGGDITLGANTIIATPTKDDEVLNIDRTTVLKPTVNMIDLLATMNTSAAASSKANLYSQVNYGSGMNAGEYYGIYSGITHTAGQTVSKTHPFRGNLVIPTNSDPESYSWASPAVFAGLMSLNGATSTIPAQVGGLLIDVSGATSTEETPSLYGAWTQVNNSGTANAVGYEGYGNNTGAGTGLNAYGVYGYAQSTNGLAAALYGSAPFGATNKNYGLITGQNVWLGSQVVYITNDVVSLAPDKTHITQSTDAGSLWVENKLEVDGGIYSDDSFTIATGKNFTLGTTQWNSGDEINGVKIKDADYGDVVIDAAGDWQVSEASDLNCTDCINATEIEDIYLLDDGDTGTGVYDFGGATSFEIPNGTDPNVSAAGQVSWDTDDYSIRAYDGTNQVVAGQKLKFITRTITKPLDLDEAATLPIWTNNTGFTFNITAIYSKSDIDNVDYTLKETSANDFTSLTTIEAVAITTDGTGVYYNDLTSGIDDSSIVSGNTIVFDNNATDDPDYIYFQIEGYLDADVD